MSVEQQHPHHWQGDRVARFDARFGPFLAIAGFIFLILIVIDLSPLPLTPTERQAVRISEVLIYALFIIEFLMRWYLSANRRSFLRHNWVNLVILLLPVLKPFTVFRLAPALTTSQALSGVAVSRRGLAGLRLLTRGRQAAYFAALTIIVVLLATAIVFSLENSLQASPFRSFSETLWWAATLVTTINSSDDPISPMGRVVAMLVRIYAVSVFSYATASVATWLIGIEPGKTGVEISPATTGLQGQRPPPASERTNTSTASD